MKPRVWALLGLAGALALVLAIPSLTHRDTIGGQAAVVSVVWLACLLVTARGRGAYAPPVLYLGIFGLFHCGLLIAVAVSERVVETLPAVGWLYSPDLSRATTLVVVGLLSFTLAAVAVPPPSPAVAQTRIVPAYTHRVAGAVGLGVQVCGLSMLVYSVERAGGLGVLSDGYGLLLLEVNGSAMFAYGMLFTGIGTVLAVVAGGRARVVAWAIFALFALLAFPFGARGAVLFPLAVLVAIEARRGRRLRLPVALLGVPVLFTLIAAVRTTRTDGIDGLFTSRWTASPIEALGEMGFSLRPAVVVLGWEAQGEPPRGGVTFIAVLLRFVERITGWNGGPPDVDSRLFNQVVMARVGPIGGSPVAEGYHNFGILGVVLVMAVIGTTVAWLSRRLTGFYADAVLGVVLVPVFVEIRNSFAVVIPQILMGMALLLVVRFVAALIAASHGPGQSAPATIATPAAAPSQRGAREPVR